MSRRVKGAATMDVFEAFPSAIISEVWEIGTVLRGTESGTKFSSLGFVDVIVDEQVDGALDTSPSAEGVSTDTLLYALPENLPKVTTAAFVGGYYWHDTETDTYYEIVEVGVGKNQESGKVEHMEFKLKPTGVNHG